MFSLPTYFPTSILQSNLARRLARIAEEDTWITHDKERGTYSNTEDLSLLELKTILGRRGLYVLSTYLGETF